MKHWNLPLVLGSILLAMLLAAVIVPTFVDMSPANAIQQTIQTEEGTSWAPYEPGRFGHLLGSDYLGRDIFYRLLLGARFTLGLAALVMLARVLLAIPVGLLVGWCGGWSAKLSTALTTTFGAVPSLILLLVLLTATQPLSIPQNYRFAFLLIIIGLPRLVEQVRQVTVHLKQLPHVEAAVSLGATPSRLVTRHVWPLMRGDVVITLAFEMAWVLILMAQMAVFGHYLLTDYIVISDDRGSYVFDGRPEWSTMLAMNAPYIRRTWWVATYPALALGTAIFCFHLLSEGLRLRWTRRSV